MATSVSPSVVASRRTGTRRSITLGVVAAREVLVGDVAEVGEGDVLETILGAAE